MAENQSVKLNKVIINFCLRKDSPGGIIISILITNLHSDNK